MLYRENIEDSKARQGEYIEDSKLDKENIEDSKRERENIEDNKLNRQIE